MANGGSYDLAANNHHRARTSHSGRASRDASHRLDRLRAQQLMLFRNSTHLALGAFTVTSTLEHAAIDAALGSRPLTEFYRGIADSRRFDTIRFDGEDWIAAPRDGAAELIIRPVGRDYLKGLCSGGCCAVAELPQPERNVA